MRTARSTENIRAAFSTPGQLKSAGSKAAIARRRENVIC